MTHVIVCTGSVAGQEWTNRVTNLRLWLIEVNTHPSVQKCILESLMSRSTMTLFTASADHLCFSAAAEQDKIGWQNFVEGKITRSWGMLQLQHYQEQMDIQTGYSAIGTDSRDVASPQRSPPRSGRTGSPFTSGRGA
jgi:hypothetical protein